jgi:hypothetical protein
MFVANTQPLAHQNLPPLHQTEFFYVSAPGLLNGQNWRDGFDAGGIPDSVAQNRVNVPAGSQMGAFWPTIVFQDTTGELLEVMYNYSSNGFTSPRKLPVTGSTGSPILVLPQTASYNGGRATNFTTIRVIYRSQSGQLSMYDRTTTGTQLPTTGAIPVNIAGNSPLAGFATARSAASGDTNTYVLYQDEGGIIRYISQTSGTEWSDPQTDAVFDGADNPTKITCATAAAMGTPSVPLGAGNDMNQCFFQAGKKLKQVHFDGKKWVNKGFVPIP